MNIKMYADNFYVKIEELECADKNNPFAVYFKICDLRDKENHLIDNVIRWICGASALLCLIQFIFIELPIAYNKVRTTCCDLYAQEDPVDPVRVQFQEIGWYCDELCGCEDCGQEVGSISMKLLNRLNLSYNNKRRTKA